MYSHYEYNLKAKFPILYYLCKQFVSNDNTLIGYLGNKGSGTKLNSTKGPSFIPTMFKMFSLLNLDVLSTDDPYPTLVNIYSLNACWPLSNFSIVFVRLQNLTLHTF